MNYDVITMDFNLVYPDYYYGLNSGGETPQPRDYVRMLFEHLFGISFIYLVVTEGFEFLKEFRGISALGCVFSAPF